MKLKYEVLWFEDNDSWFETHSDVLREFLDDNGFEMIVTRYVNGNKEIAKIFQEGDYNLILMDYNLEDSEGTDIIKSIRNAEIYTDIVFYSQSGARYIRNIIMEHGIDGIFCSDRALEDFEDKVSSIIKNTIKKVQDVNNMRGLVIAETIDLEVKIGNILKDYFKEISQEDVYKVENFKKICDNKQQQFSYQANLLKSIHDKPIDVLIDENILTTYNLYTSIQSILKSNIKELNKILSSKKSIERVEEIKVAKDTLTSIKEKISNFEEDIIFTRNTLAHVKELKDEESGVSYLKSVNKAGTTIIFDENKYVDIRKKLRNYTNYLNELYDYFKANETFSPIVHADN